MDDDENREIASTQPKKVRGTSADDATNQLLRRKKTGLISGFLARIRSLGDRSVEQAEKLQAEARADSLESGIRLSEVAERAYKAEARIQYVQENLDNIQARTREQVEKEYEAEHETSMARNQRLIDEAKLARDPKLGERRVEVERKEAEKELERREKALETRTIDTPKDAMTRKMEEMARYNEEDARIDGRNDLTDEQREELKNENYERHQFNLRHISMDDLYK